MKLFDTLDKKPKLYHIAVLSVAVFIIVFLLLEKGMEHIVTVNLILGLYSPYWYMPSSVSFATIRIPTIRSCISAMRYLWACYC